MAATTDPNWLMSTTAQSAAAIVAIVGGFLVSRLITANSSREALQARQRESIDRLRSFEQLEAEAKRRLQTHDAKSLLNDQMAYVLENDGKATVHELLQRSP